jgi:hypothetical protein
MKYQICFRDDDFSFYIDWNKIPQDIITEIEPEYLSDIMYFDSGGFISEKSVVFFKSVKRFKRGTIVFNMFDLELGV